MSYEEVLLTGLRAAVQNADRNNLVWDISLGTVVDVGQEILNTYRVICDGDSTVLTIPSLAGTLYTGNRVYVVKVPPNSLYVLGATVTMLVAPPPPPAQPLPPLVPGTAELGAIGPSPVLDIDAESDIVRTLILEDFFERTVVGVNEWGTPDIGPDWETQFVGTPGQLVQVDDGQGQMINTADYDFDEINIQAGTTDELVATFFSMEALDIQVTVPANGLYYYVTARDFNMQLFFTYFGDGTAEVELDTGLDTFTAPVPDVDADQPIDFYIQATEDRVKVWIALTSVGIDLLDPPLFDEEAFVAEGSFTFNMGGFAASEEATVGFGEVRVWSEVPPPTGLYLEDLFDRTVTGVQEWGTPNIGDPWVTDFFGDGQTIQVTSDTGQIINDSTNNGNTVTLVAGVPNFIKNYSFEIIGMTVDPAASDSVTYVTARDNDNSLTIFWFADGTAEAFLWTGLGSVGPVAIPDVTASQPIDIYMRCINDHIEVWTALTSVGLNLSDPPLFDEPAFDGFAGVFTVNYSNQASGEASSVSYDEIRIWNEGI